MPKLAMKVLGVYRLPITEELVKEQTALIFPGKLDGFPRQRAEQRSRDQLASTVLIEVLVRHCDDTFSAGDFTQPQKRKPRKSWQVAWEEKYLSEDGTSCLTARWPDPPIERDFRIAFFLHFWNPAEPFILQLWGTEVSDCQNDAGASKESGSVSAGRLKSQFGQTKIVHTQSWLDAARDPITKDWVDALIATDPELACSADDWMDMRDGRGKKTIRYYMMLWKSTPCFSPRGRRSQRLETQIVAMQTYKMQLRQLLADHGWEVVEVIDANDWWADEYWKVESRRNAWGLGVVLTFLVDPHWEAPRKKGQGVWAVTATEGIPAERLSAERAIAELNMVKGRFDKKLAAFAACLEGYRDGR